MADRVPDAPSQSAAARRGAKRGPTRRFAGLPDEAAHAIAAFFGSELRVEPYCESADSPVYRLKHRSPSGTVEVVLWPRLARADVRCGPHTWVAKEITATEIVEGIEVIFRPRAGGLLFVTLAGEVLMVSGGQPSA